MKRQADLKHYRDDEATYFDAAWIESDLMKVSWHAQYAWFRLISGPENRAHSVSVEDIDHADYPGELLANLDELRAIGAIEIHDGLITFPNLHEGTPPSDDEEN